MNDPKLLAMLDQTRRERQDYMFSSLCDQLAIQCFAAEARRSGTPDTFIEDILQAFQKAAIEATIENGRNKGLAEDVVQFVAASVQEDAQDVVAIARDSIRRFL